MVRLLDKKAYTNRIYLDSSRNNPEGGCMPQRSTGFNVPQLGSDHPITNAWIMLIVKLYAWPLEKIIKDRKKGLRLITYPTHMDEYEEALKELIGKGLSSFALHERLTRTGLVLYHITQAYMDKQQQLASKEVTGQLTRRRSVEEVTLPELHCAITGAEERCLQVNAQPHDPRSIILASRCFILAEAHEHLW